MSLYENYIEADHEFISVFNSETDELAPSAWRSFIPHQSLKDITSHVIKSIERTNRADCKPIWVSGSYGTGKTMASFVIKHLLEDDLERVEEYFRKHSLLTPLGNQFKSMRKNSKILVVYRSSSADITTSERLLLEVQQSVRKALETGGYNYLGGRTSYEAILKRLTEEDSTFNFKVAFEKYALDFGEYSNHEQVIAALQSTENLELIEKIARIMEKEGFAYFDGVEDIKNWLEDIIKRNELKAIVFIWDEFTDYFRQNRAVSTLQELAHASSKMSFFLFLITHRTVEQFSNLDFEAKKVLEDRFKMVRFQMSEVTAYGLMANVIKVKEQTSSEWEDKIVALWDRVENCAHKLKQYADGLKIEELKKLVPLHPFSAYLLSILSQQLSSNQRTMFQFLKEGANNQSEATKRNFNWFIQNHTAEDWAWLTSDIMWDYFFTLDNEDLPEEARRLINYYDSHFERLPVEELKVFKCVLLLIAMNRQLGAEKLLKPLQSNLELIFMGTPVHKKLKGILDLLVDKNLLNFNYSGSEDREFMTPMVSYDNQKLDTLKRQIESQHSFERCVEAEIIGGEFLNTYELTGHLKMRFVTRTAPAQNLKLRLNRFQNELEMYNIGVLFVVVKTEADLSKVDSIIEENKLNFERVILINVNQAFGEREWTSWLDSKTKEAYAQEINDASNARYHKENAEKVVKKWLDMTGISSMKASFNGKTYKFNRLSGLNEYLEKINEQVYPYGSEKITKNATLYKPSGYTKNTVLMGMDIKTPSGPHYHIKASLERDGFWQKEDAFNLKPYHPVSMMKKTVQNMMVKTNSVYVVEIWEALMKNHGLAPSQMAAFLFGFLMKEYADSGSYYRDDGIKTVPLSNEGLADVIESVMKQSRNCDSNTIAKMKPEHEHFCYTMKEIFEFTEAEVSSPREVKENIRRYVVARKHPFWVLQYHLLEQGIIHKYEKEKLGEIIDLICRFISAQKDNDELQIVEEAAEVLKNNSSIRRTLAKMIDIKSFKNGMESYVQKNNPALLLVAEKSGINFNQVVDDIRNYMSEDAHWLWQEKQMEGALQSIEDEYNLLNVLNNFTNSKATRLAGAEAKVEARLTETRLPWVIIKKYTMSADEKNTFEFLLSYIYNGTDLNKKNLNKKDLAIRLGRDSESIKRILDNLREVFARYLQDRSNTFLSDEQTAKMYRKLPGSAINKNTEDFNQSIEGYLNELKANQLMQDLLNLWREVSGTSSPQEWSQKMSMPILWLPGIDDPSIFLEVFKLINNRNVGNYTKIKEAMDIIEQNRAAFAVLHNKKQVDDFFIRKVAGDYAYLVQTESGMEIIKQKVKKQFGGEIFNWWAKKDNITKYIQNHLAEQYKANEYKKVLRKIDELSAEEAKKYLKDLIRQEPLVGIKILQRK